MRRRPVPPTGAPFEQVEFEGLTVTPYVGQNGRLAYSFRAMAITEPKPLPKSKAA